MKKGGRPRNRTGTGNWNHRNRFSRKTQGESNIMHQIVVTVLCRLRAPFSPRGIGPFPVPETPPPNCYNFGRIAYMNPLFSPTGNRGQKVTRNGGPRCGACLILSEKPEPSTAGTVWHEPKSEPQLSLLRYGNVEKPLSPQDPSEQKTGTARNVPHANRSRTVNQAGATLRKC